MPSSNKLTPKDRQMLKGKAHALHPIVIIGSKGLTESILTETDLCLNAHELIKIRVNADTREERTAIVETICENLEATLVDMVGHIAILFRQRNSL